MIEKLKDFWIIFKNSKHKFYEEKIEALKLLKRVDYINNVTQMDNFILICLFCK